MGVPSRILEIDWQKVQSFYDEGHNLVVTGKEFGISKDGLLAAAKRGLWKPRSRGEATALRHKNTPLKHSEETKQKLREQMLERRANGYDWTFAHAKTNGVSYPEQFFIDVIANEFQDKEYTFQYPLGKYAIDFAWPGKKIAIEIDGEQHYTQPEQQARDRRKEELLAAEGWQLLRLRWSSVMKDTKTHIAAAKRFVDGE
jgi:very-short-patch-repair endonuclease